MEKGGRKGYITEKCKKLLRKARNRYILHMTVDCVSSVLPEDGTRVPKCVGVVHLMFVLIKECVVSWYNKWRMLTHWECLIVTAFPLATMVT